MDAVFHVWRRKALQLLREVFRHRPADVRGAARAGLMPAIADGIASGDASVREAALALLALLVQHPGVVQAVQAVSCPCLVRITQRFMPVRRCICSAAVCDIAVWV